MKDRRGPTKFSDRQSASTGSWLYAGSKALKMLQKLWQQQGWSWKKLVDAGIISAAASLDDPAVRRLVFACPDIDRIARECLLSERHARRLLAKLEAASHLTVGKPETDRELTRLIGQLRNEVGIGGRRKHYNHVYFVHTDPALLLEKLVVEHDNRIAEQAVKQNQRRDRSRERSRRQPAAPEPGLFDRSPETADMVSAQTADMVSAQTADMVSAQTADMVSAVWAAAPLEDEFKNEEKGKPDQAPASIDELSPAWLARMFLHFHRGPKTRAAAIDKVAETFEEMIRLGVRAEAIRDEIERRDRTRTEPVWEMEKRLLPKEGKPRQFQGIAAWLSEEQQKCN